MCLATRWIVRSVLLALLLVPAAGTVAQSVFPGPIDWLAHEPVSLFDWGMMRANNDVKTTFEKLKVEQAHDIEARDRARSNGMRPLHTNVFGDLRMDFSWVGWEQIRGPIVGMRLSTYGGAFAPPEDSECAKMLDEFHSAVFAAAGVYYPTDPVLASDEQRKIDKQAQEKRMRDNAIVAFARWFAHYDYENPARPPGIQEYLADHAEIRVEVSKYRGDHDAVVVCSRPFASKVTTVTKQLK